MVYNPSEPRDPLGKWMKAHGGNPKASLADNVKNLNYAEEHGAAVDTKNTPTAVIDQIAKTGKDEDNRLEALMNPNISDETLVIAVVDSADSESLPYWNIRWGRDFSVFRRLTTVETIRVETSDTGKIPQNRKWLTRNGKRRFLSSGKLHQPR